MFTVKMVWMAIGTLLSVLTVQQASAEQRVCVFDLKGESGASYQLMKAWGKQAEQWGEKIKLRVYDNEAQLEKEAKEGQCAAFYMTSMRARAYNKFAGSIDALGGLPRQDIAVRAITTVLHPRNQKRLISQIGQEKYEVAGIYPIGLAYLFVKDRSIRSLAALEQQKMAVLHYDYAQKAFTDRLKIEPVMSEISNYARKFQHQEANVIAAPAYAFQQLDLNRGLSRTGGMLDLPIVHISTMLIIRPEQFKPQFASQSRAWFSQKIIEQGNTEQRYRSQIPAAYIVPVSKEEQLNSQKTLRELRISLTQQGIYDARMMSLLKAARCTLDRTNFECTISGE